MTTFLFWNINRKPLEGLLLLLLEEHLPDLVILAECKIPVAILRVRLGQQQIRYRVLEDDPSPRLVFLSRLPRRAIRLVSDDGGIAVRRILPPVGEELLLVAVHLGSKLHLESQEQSLLATRMPQLIEEAEKKVKHTRTIVLGDFNMDPFEAGITSSETLHAVMDRRIATKRARTVQGRERQFFYNPMWNFLGDASAGPPGTYFYSGSAPVTHFWYTFDQVLIRPELLANFRDENVSVLTSAGGISLLDAKGRPDTTTASDHLPLLFKI
ncbi:MAG: hypothetical protein EOO56_16170 [Hymenobacter sp.]|nr:MAG: hypothetical protein EOO56_16170 [Hymenobacter sp.]